MEITREESADFDFVIALVYDRSRIRLHGGKHALIRARLGKRMRLHGFESFHSYCEYLRHDADEEELTHVVDALATNFTGFLREKDHFEFLVEKALPSLLSPGQKRIDIWSAACATGEEPYSIAFYLSEHYPTAAGWDWRVLASDISTKALNKAMTAVYPQERVEKLPPEWVRRYLQRGHGSYEGQIRVKSSVRERVRFQQLSLLNATPMDQPFHVIFCRNVMIYFDRDTQQDLVKKLLQHLVPGGYLITGHSESLTGMSRSLHCVRPSVYQKG